MTTQDEKMPDEVYVANRHVYFANSVFNQNYDGVLLAKDARECTKYVRADTRPAPIACREVQNAVRRLEAMENELKSLPGFDEKVAAFIFDLRLICKSALRADDGWLLDKLLSLTLTDGHISIRKGNKLYGKGPVEVLIHEGVGGKGVSTFGGENTSAAVKAAISSHGGGDNV